MRREEEDGSTHLAQTETESLFTKEGNDGLKVVLEKALVATEEAIFAENEEEVGQWGVETKYPNLFLCGSSAKRGGAVSGIPGHNAAKKVLNLSMDGRI